MSFNNTFNSIISEKKLHTTSQMQNEMNEFADSLRSKNNVLFVTTSNRWSGSEQKAKSTQLAYHIKDMLPDQTINIIEADKLNIRCCSGNVSLASGNICGAKDALLKSSSKNPTGLIRCWEAKHRDDEIYKIANKIFEANAVVFFTSVRWGQTNSIYQKLIERLTWLENRWSCLGESNLLENKEAGIIVIGHNWKDKQVMQTQRQVFEMFGFKSPVPMSLYWQFTDDASDETKQSYKAATSQFQDDFDFRLHKKNK
jgi:hypothetical protein